MMPDDVIDRTLSLCPECLATIPAAIRAAPGGVVMDKSCPAHGRVVTTIASNREAYGRLCASPRKVTHPASYGGQREQGCPGDCGLCTAHDQHTCLAILEITSRCDLECPVCLAAARPMGADLSPEVVEGALVRLIELEGGVTPLQLSGGEPTQHPELGEIVRRARRLGFRKIEIDTNGLAFARDPALAEQLRAAGLVGVYLQMDGLEAGTFEYIRGRDLVAEKLAAIERCRRAGLGVVLSVTVVPGVNDGRLWDMIRFGIDQRLTGVNFQPAVVSGRFDRRPAPATDRFTLSHFLDAVETQSAGELRAGDLDPIPCPDARCGVMAYTLVRDGRLLPLGRVLSKEQLFDPMADMSDWDTLLEHVAASEASACCPGSSCCGPSPDLPSLVRGAECFAVGCHEMMDAWNFDYERAKRCCVHELTPGGMLIPFCLYSIKYRRPRPGSRPLPIVTGGAASVTGSA